MKILVGMSGGLDSSYTAMRLKSEGHEVEGAVLVMHEYTEVDSARAAASALGIPIHVIDCRDDFEKIVKSNLVNEYKNGRTPNPCIICNPEIKFRGLLNFARENGFDRIATGHYARVCEVSHGVYAVATARDEVKDQSYMLYRLPQDVLSMLLLPLGDSVKEELRSEVRSSALAHLDRKDSQEICFIPNGDHAGYIERVGVPSPKGEFVDESGKRLGEHNGIIRYTVGQRKGLGISLGARAFVTEIDPDTNRITLAPTPRVRDVFTISDMVMLPGFEDGEYDIKIRYAARPVKGRVLLHDGGRAEITLSQPAKSVTPGQSAVLYKNGNVYAGGIINFK